MPFRAWWVAAALLLAGFVFALNSCGGNGQSATKSQTPSPVAGKFQHVVIIFQENRTPDNLFQDPVLVSRGADIKNVGINSLGQSIPLTPIDLGTNGTSPDNYDLGHGHDTFKQMCDLDAATGTCKMDGADKEVILCPPGITTCGPPNAAFRYVKPADVKPYFQMAEQYTFADRMFQTNQGPSFPAHMFLLSGTSEPSVGSTNFVSDNPVGIVNSMELSGCIAPPAEHVRVIDLAGKYSTIYPCVEQNTLTDLLDTAGLSWRYYAPSAGYIWTTPTAIQHMCVPNAAPPNGTACTGPDYTAANPKVVLNQTQANSQILTDIANGQLPTVSWVIPAAQFSDHAMFDTGCGPSWVTQVVNAIGTSQYWQNTAIIITWDDWGGWYDHVAPRMYNSYEYGFRVPMIVIAPFTKAKYISHNVHDFGSILNFTESVFHLPSLGKADSRADDLSDFFDFTQSAVAFRGITPPANTAACLADTTPPGAPDLDDD